MNQPYQFQPTFMMPSQAQWMPQMQSMPSLPQMPQVPTLTGRFIKSIEEVQPNDVPMNGSAAIFPAEDMSVIYARAWNNDGTISTVRYAPVIQDDEPEQSQGITLQDVMNQLDNIQDLLKPKRTTTTRKTAAKKQEETDDDSE